MKRKAIEKIPWQSKGNKKKMAVVAKLHDIGGESTLIVDFALDKPVIRIAMTQKDFVNYVPDESPCRDMPRWGRTQYKKFLHYDSFKLPCSGYKDWETTADQETADIIHKFAHGKNDKTHTDWNSDIKYIQWEITMYKNEKSEERRYARIEKKMAEVPEVTEGFKKWAWKIVENHVMFMLPFRKKKTTAATCSACQSRHEYKHGEIRPKQIITCPTCGAQCVVKRVNYEKNPDRGYWVSQEVLLFQKIGEEFCERHFKAEYMVSLSGERTILFEIGRIFYPCGSYDSDWKGDKHGEIIKKRKTFYNKYNYYTHKEFWDDKNLPGLPNIVLCSGPVYPRTINKKMFEGTKYQYCAMELVKKENGFMPITYLEKFDAAPQNVEMMVKMGLHRLVLEIYDFGFKESGKPWEKLGITKKQLNRLRNINGGLIALKWLQYEEGNGITVDDETLKYYEKERIIPDDIDFIADRMSGRKIMNYIIRQRRQLKLKSKDILILWRDYLSMAVYMKMDVRQELIFKPKDVKQAHDDMVKLCGGADVAKRAGEIALKYPDVDDILKSIKSKYEYRDEQYAVIVPEKIESIIYEGRKLGHCLDKSDIYFDRIQRRESFIVFLRKTEDIEKPYYTLEIEPDGTTRQKRTTGDRQDKDFQEAVSFIRKWQREVRKRLDKVDKELAAQSAKLREAEFEELRKNQTKVWHGALAGKLLADVLETDLMLANG